jgi:hypothetical protein
MFFEGVKPDFQVALTGCLSIVLERPAVPRTGNQRELCGATYWAKYCRAKFQPTRPEFIAYFQVNTACIVHAVFRIIIYCY